MKKFSFKILTGYAVVLALLFVMYQIQLVESESVMYRTVWHVAHAPIYVCALTWKLLLALRGLCILSWHALGDFCIEVIRVVCQVVDWFANKVIYSIAVDIAKFIYWIQLCVQSLACDLMSILVRWYYEFATLFGQVMTGFLNWCVFLVSTGYMIFTEWVWHFLSDVWFAMCRWFLHAFDCCCEFWFYIETLFQECLETIDWLVDCSWYYLCIVAHWLWSFISPVWYLVREMVVVVWTATYTMITNAWYSAVLTVTHVVLSSWDTACVITNDAWEAACATLTNAWSSAELVWASIN